MHASRRRFLVQAMAGAGLLSLSPPPALAASGILIPNVTGLYPVEVARVVAPASTQDVAQAVRDWPGKIAVGGGRYSMGGQVAIRGGLHLDMRGMNRLLRLEPQARVARVQGGRYYLPYQLHATRSQFERAYPEVESLRQLKHSVDPRGRFTNELWAAYL